MTNENNVDPLTGEIYPPKRNDYGLSDHKELLDRARRTETKLTNLISALGQSLPDDGKHPCEVSVRSGTVEVLIDAADTPISTIKAAVIKAGFDLRTVSDVRIILGGSTFGYINFNT